MVAEKTSSRAQSNPPSERLSWAPALPANFRETAAFRALQQQLTNGISTVLLEGGSPVLGALLACALSLDRPVVLVAGSPESADRLSDAVGAFLGSPDAALMVGHSPAFLEDDSHSNSIGAIAERLIALDLLVTNHLRLVIVTIPGLLQHTFGPDDLRLATIELRPGSTLDLSETLRRLVGLGYERVDVAQSRGEFASRGSILDVYPANGASPVRIDLFGDEIESIRRFDANSQRSTGRLESVRILPATEPLWSSEYTFVDFLPENALLFVDDASSLNRRWTEFHDQSEEQLRAFRADRDAESVEAADVRRYAPPFTSLENARRRLETFQTVFSSRVSRTTPWGHLQGSLPLPCDPAPHFDGDMHALVDHLKSWRSNQVQAWMFTPHWLRLEELLSGAGVTVRSPRTENLELPPIGPQDLVAHVGPGSLQEGCLSASCRVVVLSDGEIFGTTMQRRSPSRFRDSAPLTSLLELEPGTLVVHIDHGIGRFRGLKSMDVEGVHRDYLFIEYAQGDKLFVPTDQINRVQRYIGSEDHAPAVHRLGGQDWARTKRRVRSAVEDMARELIAINAARVSREGHAYGPDTPWQSEMEAAFPYTETPDQLRAIQEIKRDLQSDKPMDRLVCGDVGYGKTEVAIRAAFKVVLEGKQVAVLSPTTVLAQQHLNTFVDRLRGFPVKVEMLSRFRSRKEQAAVVESLKDGSVDIVIGTHRLLSKDVGFKDLGLVVVDEEQRFGVAHKERLKQLRTQVDVLTLTATPIPRTLHMTMATLRDMSVMNQAPEGRSPIRTYLREYNDEVVQECLIRELDRNGQVYYVHNRIESLPHIAERIRQLVPRARVIVGHGQMSEQALEQVMMDFYEHRADVLCCTTIIESGLDIPNVNTICIEDADRMGLAQLYQLRGRVGRSNRQAYCYLFFKPEKELSETAQKRLEALREFSELGSGFRIALRDLEIRGAGNLLGAEQSGVMISVGFDLYCQMIADAVRTLRNEPPPPAPAPPVDLPIAAYLPAEYIPVEGLRVEFYKRLSSPTSVEEIQAVQEELQDRFGTPPLPVRNLLAILRLRLRCKTAGVTSITSEKDAVVVRLGPRLRLMPGMIASLTSKHRGVRFLEDRAVVPIGSRGALGPVGELLDSLVATRQQIARRHK